MTTKKSNFQPKDARTFSLSYEDEEDEEDMSDLLPNHEKGRRVRTGTQALVEFLKTTSPEEFQRSAPERSTNNLFSRIRKTKRSNSNNHQPIIPTPSISSRSVPSSTTSLPVTLTSTLTAPTSHQGSNLTHNHTIHRKNYIEIVPQQKLVSMSAGNSRSPSFDTTSIQSFVLRNNSTNNNNNNNNNKSNGEPILPNKKRESSLYSGSLRYSASIRSQLSTITNNNTNANSRRPLIRDNSTSQKLNLKATEDFLNLRDGMDTIESALLQRLEKLKLLNEEIPSDKIAAGLATEHIRALGITHILDNQHLEETDKTKIRHMQVQTENTYEEHTADTLLPEKTITTEEDGKEDPEIRAKRAEAALENALDHFEVISGLAYKKLREIWEEKIRWENACMELRDRVLILEQKRMPSLNDHGLIGHHRDDYFIDEKEEEDELGLSEFPCSEN